TNVEAKGGPRHPLRPLPLLPSGPGGVHRLGVTRDHNFSRRREGDSNPRYLSVYTISSRAPSASRSSLRVHASRERGIRTPGTLARTPDFESGAFSRSAISPELHGKRLEERRALVGEDAPSNRHRVVQSPV